MNRREFIYNTGVSLVGMSILKGCPSQTTIAQFVTLIGDDAAALASYFGDTTLANNLKNWAAQIATDITNWQGGKGAVQDIIQAIKALMSLVGTIPVIGNYAPLIDLILSALSGLLLLLPGATGATIPHDVNGHVVLPNHYKDASNKTMTAAAKAFTSQWEALTAVTPIKR